MPLRKATVSDLAAASAGMRAPWRDRAACRNRAGLLDPDHPEWLGESRAVAFCHACPVTAECRAWVLSLPATVDVGGVCGGTTEHERARARGGPWGGSGDVKYCARCGVTKAASEFWRDKSRNDGLKPYCRPCTTEMARGARQRTA